MKQVLALMATLLLLVPASATAQTPAPCSSPEARQLDFWLGAWNLTWSGGQGTNDITRRFGECVIEENFAGELPSGPYLGHSISVYNPRTGGWQQTWVDSQGGYLVFTGGPDEDGVMRLRGVPSQLPDGRTQDTRMSWVHVEDDALDWNWERSFDGGQTWEMVWDIHYERR